MTADIQRVSACAGWAAAAVAFFALHSVASAQGAAPALSAVSGATPMVAPAAPPAPTPVLAGPATPITPPPAACNAPAELARLDRPLIHTMRRLASGEPLTIVAIGSSSTAGAGASSPTASYPSRLAVELKARFSGRDITVLNRGVNGEETDNMMARFDRDVMAAHPQLVIWQVGTNSVLRDHPLNPHAVELREGIAELKAAGADVILVDPQYAPQVLAKPETQAMVEQIALAAKQQNVDLFPRFAVMRNWYEAGHLGFDVFVSPDHLHMNDWSYACLAKLLGAAIGEAATRPIAAAHGAHTATLP